MQRGVEGGGTAVAPETALSKGPVTLRVAAHSKSVLPELRLSFAFSRRQ